MSAKGDGFEAKLADLVAVTQRLDVLRIVMLRRLTLADPQSLKWASAHQLDLIFNVILSKALERTDTVQLQAASAQHFDPLLPPGSEEEMDKERWLLFDLAKPILSAVSANGSAHETTAAVLDKLEEDAQEEVDDQPESYGDFATLLDDTLLRHMKRTLAAMAAAAIRPHIPLPFYMAPPFAAVFLDFLRGSMLPGMRATRRMKEVALSRNWTEAGAAGRIIGMIQSGENNAILQVWDARWQTYQPGHPIKGKDGKSKPRPVEDLPWETFKEDGLKHGYVPPFPSDMPMLQRLLRLDGDIIAEAWTELCQFYEQEFHPKSRSEQGRPGSFRDSLLKFIDKLDHHGGDILTIRAFFDLPKVDRLFVKQLIQTLGRTDKERLMRAPLLIAFYNDLPK